MQVYLLIIAAIAIAATILIINMALTVQENKRRQKELEKARKAKAKAKAQELARKQQLLLKKHKSGAVASNPTVVVKTNTNSNINKSKTKLNRQGWSSDRVGERNDYFNTVDTSKFMGGNRAEKTIDFEPIVEMSKILTDNDKEMVDTMRYMARNYEDFVEDNKVWCDSVSSRILNGTKRDFVECFFADWLCAFRRTGVKFGVFMAGNEKPENIMNDLVMLDNVLGYGLGLAEISISEAKSAAMAVQIINGRLVYKRYMIISLETNKNASHLFIVPSHSHDRLIELANKVDFNFYRQLAI